MFGLKLVEAKQIAIAMYDLAYKAEIPTNNDLSPADNILTIRPQTLVILRLTIKLVLKEIQPD